MVNDNDLEEILAQELERIKEREGKVNLAEVERRTGISRAILRRWQKNGYELKKGKRGRPSGKTKISGYEELINGLLSEGVTNSVVIRDRLMEQGYCGGLTIVKEYIGKHKDLVPDGRHAAEPLGNRGRRYTTERGDCYQMDWGFVDVEDEEGNEWRSACFVMVCHHCGFRYVEFLPNARQENLFIGMIHSFALMGIPRRVLTDNMKSVATGRDAVGNVIYNREYDEFQHLLGFRTDLCKVAHPFTKGSVERLVRYVKGNFIQARRFLNVTDLNEKALAWCMEKNGKVLRERQCIPMEEHKQEKEGMIQMCDVSILLPYLAPFRSISFDGYVEYEGRRFGVPYSYSERKARVMRSGSKLKILTAEGNLVKEYPVDWSKASKSCPEQWLPVEGPSMPEEKPTTAVRAVVHVSGNKECDRFSRFSFRREVCDEH